ncbi:MAG: universal stress protein [Candidatus Binatia bacterium]|nr:MAG: universal stress protein [Candidatus Binatia bacterium]
MPREFKTILCPTDFSEDSYLALEYARQFAELSQGKILLPHVIHVPTESLYDEHGRWQSSDQIEKRAWTLLQKVREEKLAGFPNVEPLVIWGNPVEELVALCKERNVDLLVICTHGRTGLRHLLLGSVAENLIRLAPCPVFVVRRGAK